MKQNGDLWSKKELVISELVNFDHKALSMDDSYNKRALRGELLQLIKKAEYVQKARTLHDRLAEIKDVQEYFDKALSHERDLKDQIRPYLEKLKKKLQPTEEAPNHLECSIGLVASFDPDAAWRPGDRQQRYDLRATDAHGQHQGQRRCRSKHASADRGRSHCGKQGAQACY